MELTRGYDRVHKKLHGEHTRFIRSCDNCKYYYKDKGDEEELCQNNKVLEYDMIIEENRVYCLRWKPYERSD